MSVKSNRKTAPVARSNSPAKDALVLENKYIIVNFSDNGLISSVTNKASGLTVNMNQTFCYYTSNEGDKKSAQRSGAYIFRPKTGGECLPSKC